MHFGLAVHWPARPFVSRSPISIVCDLYEWLKLFLLFYFIVVFVFCCRCWWEINEWTNEASTVSINEWTNEWMSVHATCMHGCVCVCVCEAALAVTAAAWCDWVGLLPRCLWLADRFVYLLIYCRLHKMIACSVRVYMCISTYQLMILHKLPLILVNHYFFLLYSSCVKTAVHVWVCVGYCWKCKYCL